jgi:hypothetical protein
MELKEFIEEAISAIIDSTTELQKKYADEDIVINPPSAQSGADVFQPRSGNYTMRRVKNVDFDVAVTAATESSKSGGAGIKVVSLNIGGKGAKSASSEQVSRVSFSIPLTLKPSSHEGINMAVATEKRDRPITPVPPTSNPMAGMNRNSK